MLHLYYDCVIASQEPNDMNDSPVTTALILKYGSLLKAWDRYHLDRSSFSDEEAKCIMLYAQIMFPNLRVVYSDK